MKNKLIPILILAVVMPGFGWGKDNNDNSHDRDVSQHRSEEKKGLRELFALRKQIKSSEGFSVHVVLFQGKPTGISVLHERLSKAPRDNAHDYLLDVSSKEEPMAVANFKKLVAESRTRPSGKTGTKEDEREELIRFDNYDKNGVLKHSFWLNEKNGFDAKNASFDGQGRLVSYAFNLNTIFDQPQRLKLPHKSPKSLNMEDVLKQHPDERFDSLEQLEGLSRKLILENFPEFAEKLGLEDSDSDKDRKGKSRGEHEDAKNDEASGK